MNLEQFYEKAQKRVRGRKKFFKIVKSFKKVFIEFLKYREDIRAYLKRQLRYGAIRYEILEHRVYGVLTHLEINVIYKRQIHDPQINDSTLDNFFRKKKWKKTKINIVSFLTALYLVLFYIFQELKETYYSWFPKKFDNVEFHKEILKMIFEMLLKQPTFSDSFSFIKTLSVYFAHTIADFCIFFNFIIF